MNYLNNIKKIVKKMNFILNLEKLQILLII